MNKVHLAVEVIRDHLGTPPWVRLPPIKYRLASGVFGDCFSIERFDLKFVVDAVL